MTEIGADHLERLASIDRAGRVSMTEIMYPEVLDLRARRDLLPRVAYALDVIRATFR